MPTEQSISTLPTTSRGRRRRQLTMALVAVVALSTAGSTAQAKTHHHSTSLHAKRATEAGVAPRNPYAGLANFAAGFMTSGNNVPQGGARYQPGFAGWADFARGYAMTHPAG